MTPINVEALSPADVVALAEDVLADIEREVLRTDDPGRLSELEIEHDEVWAALETAQRLAAVLRARQAIAEGVAALLQGRHQSYGAISKSTERKIARVQERKREGLEAVEQLGLSRWLKPRE